MDDSPIAASAENYQESDIFLWSNNLVGIKEELTIELFLFNKNHVMYKTSRSKDLEKQLQPILVDEILEYVLAGADEGLIVRGFEEAESEDKVLMRTQVNKIPKLKETLGWLKTQEHEMEMFVEEEHDIKRIKGVVARIRHKDLTYPVYVIKQLPQSQVIKGASGWMIRNGKFVPFDAEGALRVPSDNQLLVLDQDIYVFNAGKLETLFGYNAKKNSIAESKAKMIEENFKLSFAEGLSLQSIIKDKKALINKLQKLDPTAMKQEQLLDHAEEMGLDLMTDESGAIIIMDARDLIRFINLLNDDYMESAVTGLRYEVKSKRPLKIDEEESMMTEMHKALKST